MLSAFQRRRWSTTSLIGITGKIKVDESDNGHSKRKLLYPTRTITKDDFFPNA